MAVRNEITIKRVYAAASPQDGTRVLVDRVWPRGLTKAQVQADMWLKEIAPSNALRKWFNHEPERWEEFKRRYFAELDANPAAVERLLDAANAAPESRLTLLFSAKDEQRNQAAALQMYLLKR